MPVLITLKVDLFSIFHAFSPVSLLTCHGSMITEGVKRHLWCKLVIPLNCTPNSNKR